MRSDTRNPILEQILSDNSSVVFDVAARAARAQSRPQLFGCRALNSTTIFKLPNFEINSLESRSENAEWDLAALLNPRGQALQRPIETGIFIPYSIKDRGAGGVILYVRQRNFGPLVKEFLGLNHDVSEGPTKRDIDILEKIDGIPSLDPFLLKLTLEKPFPDIDRIFFDISDFEDAAVRETIAKKVVPIARKALGKEDASKDGISNFVDAIWDPAAPEARLFVKAFGISDAQATETFEAWRGISFYEWSYGRLVQPIAKLLGWLKSELAKPTDNQRIGSHQRQQIETFRSAIGHRISANAKAPDQFFRNYNASHQDFVNNGDPTRFRKFLQEARASYWELGWSVTALTHAIGIFSRAMARGSGGQLTAEVLYTMYRDLDLALLKNKSSVIATEPKLELSGNSR
jgi:hypothetical protein